MSQKLKKKDKEIRKMLKGFFESVDDNEFETSMPFVKNKKELIRAKAQEAKRTSKRSLTRIHRPLQEEFPSEEVGLVTMMKYQNTVDLMPIVASFERSLTPIRAKKS